MPFHTFLRTKRIHEITFERKSRNWSTRNFKRCKKQVDNCLKSDTSEILALQNNCYKYKDEKLDQFSDYRSIICLSRHKREFLSAFLELSSVVEKSVKLPHQHCCQYRIFAQKHSIYYESKFLIILCSRTFVSFLVAGRGQKSSVSTVHVALAKWPKN